MPVQECHVLKPGVMDYHAAWELQVALAQRVQQGMQPNTLLLLQHPPVYTIGRRGRRDHVLLDDEHLAELGIALHEADRGGEVTCHGPGQMVAYPVLNLREWGGPVKYVRTLERVIIGVLTDFGVAAGLVEGLTGVWAGGEKIAAIGVRLSRGISYHGFALNVSNDLSYFDHIIPCGINEMGVTSVEKVLERPVDIDLVAYSLVYHLGREMGFRMVEAEDIPGSLATGQMAG